MPLTDLALKNLKPQDKPYKVSDAKCLYVLVHTTGTISFRFKFMFEGKAQSMNFGLYPTISLQQARKMRDDAKHLIAQGVNPAIRKKVLKQCAHTNLPNTFEVIAREWLARNTSLQSENHYRRVLDGLILHVFPYLAKRPWEQLLMTEFMHAMDRLAAVCTPTQTKLLHKACLDIFAYAHDKTKTLKGN